VKFVLELAMKARGEETYRATLSLTLALEGEGV
jgi:hypothetical protein